MSVRVESSNVLRPTLNWYVGGSRFCDAQILGTNHRPVLVRYSTGALLPTSHKVVTLAPRRLRQPKASDAADKFLFCERISAELDYLNSPPDPEKDFKDEAE